MANTALNRTTQVLLTNKSGGALNYGDVVVLDNTNANGFTTTTTAGLSTRGLGVILEPAGIANNASGMVAVGGWCPRVNLNTAATVGQFIKTHTVAGQGTPHSSPQVEGDFAVALTASANPPCNLFGSPNGPTSGGSGTVTNTGTLTANALILGNGGVDVAPMASLGTTTTVLHGNAAGAPTFGAVSLTADVSGTLPVGNGGTGQTSYTDGQLLIGNSTGNTLTKATLTAGSGISVTNGSGAITIAATGSSGKVVQVVNTQTGAVATGSTYIPDDDSIPQNTEGDQYMSLAITPTNASNLLKIDVVFNGGCSESLRWTTVALFQDSGANALAAGREYNETGTAFATVAFSHFMTAGTTSATTFKVRAGGDINGASSMTFNGQSGSRKLGGVLASSITITELAP